MKQFNVRYDKSWHIVVALLLPGVIYVPLFMSVLLYLPGIPDWAVITVIVASLGVTLAFALYLVKRISPQALLTLKDDGFTVEFLQKDLFTPRSFEIKINDINNISLKGNKVGYYMKFSTHADQSEFNISQAGRGEEHEAVFKELMTAMFTMVNDKTKFST